MIKVSREGDCFMVEQGGVLALTLDMAEAVALREILPAAERIVFLDSHGGVWTSCGADEAGACAFGPRGCARQVALEDVADGELIMVGWSSDEPYMLAGSSHKARTAAREADMVCDVAPVSEPWGFQEEA